MTPQERAAKIRAATLATVEHRNHLVREAEAEVLEVYKQAAEAIVQHIEAAGDGDGRVSLSNLQAVLTAVQAQIKAMSTKRDTLLFDRIAQAAKLGTSPFKTHLNADAVFAVNHNAVAFVRGFSAADGLQLSDRLWRINRGAVETLSEHIQHAVIHGENGFEAMMRSMGKGDGVGHDVEQAYNAAKTGAIGRSVRELMTGAPDPRNGKGVVYQAQRVFNTEIMRAHGEAYMSSAFDTDGVAGVKFNLSPNHPKKDICDTHASADLYNLGAGVYPSRAACPWPAHPNTFSYVTAVFDFEIEGHPQKDNPSDAAPAPEERASDIGPHGLDELISRGAVVRITPHQRACVYTVRVLSARALCDMRQPHPKRIRRRSNQYML